MLEKQHYCAQLVSLLLLFFAPHFFFVASSFIYSHKLKHGTIKSFIPTQRARFEEIVLHFLQELREKAHHLLKNTPGNWPRSIQGLGFRRS